MQQEEVSWPRVAVMGAGAVGGFFGGRLARAGAKVTLIGRPTHVEAVHRRGLVLEEQGAREHVPVQASTEASSARDAEIVLLSVKTLDTESAARAVAPHLSPGAILVSLQNGVENVERIRDATGIEAVAAAVYVGAEMAGPGHVKHTARGDLLIGFQRNRRDPPIEPAAGGRQRLERVVSLFTRAEVPCRVSTDIEAELWTKLAMNCAYNAVSALTRSRYGRVVANPYTRLVVRQLVVEAASVAQAAGVQVTREELLDAAERLAAAMPGTLSSTAQDILRGRPTEIDALNGFIARRGAELGVDVPVNRTVHALVKQLEASGA